MNRASWRKGLEVERHTERADHIIGVSVRYQGFEVAGAAKHRYERRWRYYGTGETCGMTKAAMHRFIAAWEMAEEETVAMDKEESHA